MLYCAKSLTSHFLYAVFVESGVDIISYIQARCFIYDDEECFAGTKKHIVAVIIIMMVSLTFILLHITLALYEYWKEAEEGKEEEGEVEEDEKRSAKESPDFSFDEDVKDDFEEQPLISSNYITTCED